MRTATVIPAATVTVALEDASVDLVCFEHARAVLGDARQAGRLTAYVTATLKANPGLAALGPILPLGTVIALPEFVIERPRAAVRLWD